MNKWLRPPFSRIVMFGDSLSDTGKMYGKMRGYLPSSPPYYQGRFSNGPVWLERLTQPFPGLKIVNETIWTMRSPSSWRRTASRRTIW